MNNSLSPGGQFPTPGHSFLCKDPGCLCPVFPRGLSFSPTPSHFLQRPWCLCPAFPRALSLPPPQGHSLQRPWVSLPGVPQGPFLLPTQGHSLQRPWRLCPAFPRSLSWCSSVTFPSSCLVSSVALTSCKATTKSRNVAWRISGPMAGTGGKRYWTCPPPPGQGSVYKTHK